MLLTCFLIFCFMFHQRISSCCIAKAAKNGFSLCLPKDPHGFYWFLQWAIAPLWKTWYFFTATFQFNRKTFSEKDYSETSIQEREISHSKSNWLLLRIWGDHLFNSSIGSPALEGGRFSWITSDAWKRLLFPICYVPRTSAGLDLHFGWHASDGCLDLCSLIWNDEFQHVQSRLFVA